MYGSYERKCSSRGSKEQKPFAGYHVVNGGCRGFITSQLQCALKRVYKLPDKRECKWLMIYKEDFYGGCRKCEVS